MIAIESFSQSVNWQDLTQTSDARDGYLGVNKPSGGPTSWQTFQVSYTDFLQYIQNDVDANATRIGEISDSVTISYDTVFDAWTAIVEIRTRNNNQTDSIVDLYDTAAVHLDTLILHGNQIASILSDLDTKLNQTDTTNMLAPYAKQIALEDTAAAIRGDFPETADTAQFAHNVDSAKSSFAVGNNLNVANNAIIGNQLTIDGDELYNDASGFHIISGTVNFILGNNNNSYHNMNANATNGVMFYTNGSIFQPTLTYSGDQNTGLGRTGVDKVALWAGGVTLDWDGTHLISENNDTAAWKRDLGTGGGSSDSSSITYGVDTVKAFNNTDIYFDDPINVNGAIGVNQDISSTTGVLSLNSGSAAGIVRLRPHGIGSSTSEVSINQNFLMVNSDNIRAGINHLELSSAGAGHSVIFRPNGFGSSTAQTVFSTTFADFGTKAKFDSTVTLNTTEQVWDSIAFSSTINVDFTDGSDYKMVVVTGDITINVTDLYGGESVLWIIQDGTGSHTVTKGTGWGDLRGSGTISTDADAISVVQWQKAVGPGAYTKVIHWID